MIRAIRFALSYWRIIAAVVGVIGLAAVWWQYRAGLIEQGREQIRAQVQRAIDQQQAIYDQNAAIFEAYRGEAEIRYRTQIKEVVRHVSTDDACTLPDDTRRMLNDALSGAAFAPGQPDR